MVVRLVWVVIVTSSAIDKMFEIFGPIFEQNVAINFEPIFEQNANFEPIFEKSAYFGPIFEKKCKFRRFSQCVTFEYINGSFNTDIY